VEFLEGLQVLQVVLQIELMRRRFPAGLKGMEGAGMIPAPHKSRGDPLMDGGDVGADPRLRTHILRVERRLLRRRGL
jgi:hypothetical protein